MTCPKCNGPTEWRGSFSRGRLVCPGCDSESKSVGPSPVMQRYHAEVYSFHRDWCHSRKMVNPRPGTQTDPANCDCGHLRPCPHDAAEVERREIGAYGDIRK